MKQFVAQQKTDYRSTKNTFKKQFEEDASLSNVQRKQMLEERKKELQIQQKGNEEEHLRMLRAIADQKKIEFKQKAMQDRQGFEKELLQQVIYYVM